METPSPGELLEVAQEAALAAGRRTLDYFGAGTAVEWKADGSPRTRADLEAEEILRAVIRGAYPGHAILGEEAGEEAGTEPVRWIVDPIDGTRTFIHGVPLYGTLVGVEVEGEPVAELFFDVGENVEGARIVGEIEGGVGHELPGVAQQPVLCGLEPRLGGLRPQFQEPVGDDDQQEADDDEDEDGDDLGGGGVFPGHQVVQGGEVAHAGDADHGADEHG